MRRVIRRAGDVPPGKMTFTIERGSRTLVLEGVPARVEVAVQELAAA